MGVRPTWTDKDQALMERLADQGLSASFVAERLGKTRNAVLGRAWRTGVQFYGWGREHAQNVKDAWVARRW